jgi:hypothetical protein
MNLLRSNTTRRLLSNPGLNGKLSWWFKRIKALYWHEIHWEIWFYAYTSEKFLWLDFTVFFEL